MQKFAKFITTIVFLKLVLSPVVLYILLGLLHLCKCMRVAPVIEHVVEPSVVGCYLLLSLTYAFHDRVGNPLKNLAGPGEGGVLATAVNPDGERRRDNREFSPKSTRPGDARANRA